MSQNERYGTILVVAYQKKTLRTIMDQLDEIELNKYFTLQGRTADEVFNSNVPGNVLVLMSSRIVHMMIKPYMPAKAPYIIAKRTINYAGIRDILELPKEQKILLVSDLKETAEDTVFMQCGCSACFRPILSGGPP